MPEGTTEGAASTTEQSASLGGQTDTATQETATQETSAWDQVSQGGETAEAQTAEGSQAAETATPEAQPETATEIPPGTAQSAATEAAPAAATPIIEEDPFDKITDPKAADFQSIRANRKEVIAKLNEAQPLVAAIESIGGADVLGMVAPLLQPFKNLEKGLETARDFVTKAQKLDPQIDKVLKQAMYEAHKDTYYGWALEDNGIKPDDFKAFLDFKESGGQSASPQSATAAFPEPDEQGYVQLEDGTVLDTKGDPGHKVAYELAKKEHAREQQAVVDKANDDKTRIDTERTAAEAEQAKVQQERATRVHTFAAERDTVFDAAFEKLKVDCGEDTDDAKEMIMALVQSSVGKNEELAGLAAEARRLAGEGGQAAASKGLAMDRIGFKALADATAKVTNLYRELHELRQQAGGGRAQIPKPATPQASTFKTNGEIPAELANVNADPLKDIWDQVGKS
jgi:hypothetical protein